MRIAQSCLLQTLETLLIWSFTTYGIRSKVFKDSFLNEETSFDGLLPNCKDLYKKPVEYSLGL